MNPTRRGVLAAIGSVAVAGCAGTLGVSGEAGATAALEGLADPPDRFDDDPLRERYGDHGVWGLTTGPGTAEAEYRGVWQESLAVGPRGDRFLTGDAVALCYRLGEGYRVWLWAAAEPRQREEGFGRANVTRVTVRAEAPPGWSLVGFAPRGPAREGPVPVSLGDGGPSGRTPLPGGGIGPVTEATATGPDGGATVAWRGIAGSVRSVNAVCAFVPTDGPAEPFSVPVSARLGGGRGVL